MFKKGSHKARKGRQGHKEKNIFCALLYLPCGLCVKPLRNTETIIQCYEENLFN